MSFAVRLIVLQRHAFLFEKVLGIVPAMSNYLLDFSNPAEVRTSNGQNYVMTNNFTFEQHLSATNTDSLRNILVFTADQFTKLTSAGLTVELIVQF